MSLRNDLDHIKVIQDYFRLADPEALSIGAFGTKALAFAAGAVDLGVLNRLT